MTRTYRRTLFLISSILFFIAAMIIVLFSLGYRLSKDGGIVKTGGLFIASVPSTEVQIFVNNKFVKKTALISRSIFMQSLTPATYNIRIEREGFHTWEKNIVVEPERVSEVRALMVKDPVDGKILSRGNFISIEAESEKILKVVTEKKETRFFDTEKEEFLSTIPEKSQPAPETLPSTAQAVLLRENPDGYDIDAEKEKILWWDGRTILVEWLNPQTLPFYTKESTIKIIDSNQPIREAVFYPRRDAVIATYENAVMIIELDGRGGHVITPVYKGKKPNIALLNPKERILYILDDGNIIRAELL
ncbi:MAG: hypothetical protein A3C80_01895 [Candidatus Ryanbacteria bacterium RIFCSPHIGHO2_02_FULL_45_43]|uniref:PEGA domain-containing protein n=1 Tax=Candidatus Ryanbacteria bacterium RIFCSPHIGHO2_01_45_13 TaxID=1802112 RepID=A0A1G2FZ29_9BACT|nr:MAG: hypothetical protein A2718_02730 [Candidatus Ryanbacteria bacterium RIFCSPHIGHO2_01_FULL_44_130]OGZ42992.1 MAG: hypothetical protein A2W41_02670 [Candidatus Ryanbacteria bacterium RIFCSPHIGHO2_01_45_13]OGZ48697.1 MAG: hypothetical protein A3C80_01895 [Candidatus Ryanbacteria bacterium RIFCSPHIGHO2_02_FULL_45_43]OGZ50637.1 MAG: hypothetical protein A3E55_03375 [Candidatus Ryanbacteria bacterium RIFCSPHIGHO2_12_FULL_44_20]OGZ51943.1 MAG: hypothetical protein A3A17_00750 [Candidatus Ryanba